MAGEWGFTVDTVDLCEPRLVQENGADHASGAGVRLQLETDRVRLHRRFLVHLENIPATLLRDLQRVNQVHLALGGPAEEAGQSGAPQEVGVAVGNLAAIDQAHGPRVTGRDAGREVAEALGQGRVRSEGAILLR